MIITCDNGAIDVAALNDFLPDDKRPFCAISPVTESYDGAAFLTTDGERVPVSAVAFKSVLDMLIRVGSDAAMYLYNVCARSRYDLAVPPPDSPFGAFLSGEHISGVSLPDMSLCPSYNFKALYEHDVCRDFSASSLRYGMVGDMLGILSGLVYMRREGTSAMDMYRGLSSLFSTVGADYVRWLLSVIYGALDTVSEPARFRYSPASMPFADTFYVYYSIGGATDPTLRPDEPDAAGDVGDVSDADSASVARTPIEPVDIVPLSAADITGIDVTDSLGYLDDDFDKALEKADSEGFLNGVISARLNGGASPVDLLNEKVFSVGSESGLADVRSKISEIADDIRELDIDADMGPLRISEPDSASDAENSLIEDAGDASALEDTGIDGGSSDSNEEAYDDGSDDDDGIAYGDDGDIFGGSDNGPYYGDEDE